MRSPCVYDALISKRVYKDAMSHESAIAYICGQSGRHFDPEIVAALETVQDQFQVIAQKYMDN